MNNTICFHCQKVLNCPTFQTLCSMSGDFSIRECKQYDACFKYEYRKIANNDELMHLIYDYFTGQVEGNFTDEQIVSAIKNAMLNL